MPGVALRFGAGEGGTRRSRSAAVPVVPVFRAVLAAAGSPDLHPHATSDAEERAGWDRDVANVRRDLERLEAFFTALLDGKLDEKARNEQGMAFVSKEDVPQGAFYTVGWTMAAEVERRLGRERVVASLCDPVLFLTDYNQATAKTPLPRWSDALLERLRAR